MTDAILQTKLHVPLLRSSLVPRPHLTDKLNAGMDGRLILISAQAGSGKTTLIAEWLSQSDYLLAQAKAKVFQLQKDHEQMQQDDLYLQEEFKKLNAERQEFISWSRHATFMTIMEIGHIIGLKSFSMELLALGSFG